MWNPDEHREYALTAQAHMFWSFLWQRQLLVTGTFEDVKCVVCTSTLVPLEPRCPTCGALVWTKLVAEKDYNLTQNKGTTPQPPKEDPSHGS